MARDRVVLVDGSALLYRAFFALPSTLSTAAGVPTNATFGFATMCRKVFAGKRPAFGAVVFDAAGRTFREERFPAYKAQRPSMPVELRAQLANIDRVVQAFGLPSLRLEGYEADDIIATLTREALEAGHEVHIVSSDKDFAQLVGEHVRMVDAMRDVSYDDEQPAEDTAPSPPATVASTPAELQPFLKHAASGFALEAIYDGPTPVAATLYGVALATTDEALFVPHGQPGAAADLQAVHAVLATALADVGVPKRVHNARDTHTVLEAHGFTLQGVALDTQLASYLVDPTAHLPHELEQVARAYLQRVLPALEGEGASRRARPVLGDATAAARASFACDRAQAVADLTAPLEALLDEHAQRATLSDVELPLARVLADMQRAGVRVDAAALTALSAEFEQRKAQIEAEIYELAGREFNLASPKQLGEVLFDELGLPVLKRTKTGYSTDASVLERLAPKHPIAERILRQRELAKLINTYTEVLRAAINPTTGRVHCTFQQTTSASGRLITTEPDLQRTPIRGEDGKRIRAAFLPRPGWVMVSADWSQIELRLLAHLSDDPALTAAFRDEVDVHRRTAAEIFGCPADDVTREQRNVGKTVNFATIYGQGATALGQGLGVTRNEAKAYIDRYFEAYGGVRAWLDASIAGAHATGYVDTMLGRRRNIPELSTGDPSTRSYGERIAANTPIQGSAADLCKLAMLRIARRLTDENLEAAMVLQIHDELLFEVAPAHLEPLVAIVRHEMEQVWPELRVPLVVDVGHGASWEEAHG